MEPLRDSLMGVPGLTLDDLIERLKVLSEAGRGGERVVMEIAGMAGNDAWSVDRYSLTDVFWYDKEPGEGKPIVLGVNTEISDSWEEPLFIDMVAGKAELWGGKVEVKLSMEEEEDDVWIDELAEALGEMEVNDDYEIEAKKI